MAEFSDENVVDQLSMNDEIASAKASQGLAGGKLSSKVDESQDACGSNRVYTDDCPAPGDIVFCEVARSSIQNSVCEEKALQQEPSHFARSHAESKEMTCDDREDPRSRESSVKEISGKRTKKKNKRKREARIEMNAASHLDSNATGISGSQAAMTENGADNKEEGIAGSVTVVCKADDICLDENCCKRSISTMKENAACKGNVIGQASESKEATCDYREDYRSHESSVGEKVNEKTTKKKKKIKLEANSNIEENVASHLDCNATEISGSPAALTRNETSKQEEGTTKNNSENDSCIIEDPSIKEDHSITEDAGLKEDASIKENDFSVKEDSGIMEADVIADDCKTENVCGNLDELKKDKKRKRKKKKKYEQEGLSLVSQLKSKDADECEFNDGTDGSNTKKCTKSAKEAWSTMQDSLVFTSRNPKTSDNDESLHLCSASIDSVVHDSKKITSECELKLIYADEILSIGEWKSSDTLSKIGGLALDQASPVMDEGNEASSSLIYSCPKATVAEEDLANEYLATIVNSETILFRSRVALLKGREQAALALDVNPMSVRSVERLKDKVEQDTSLSSKGIVGKFLVNSDQNESSCNSTPTFCGSAVDASKDESSFTQAQSICESVTDASNDESSFKQARSICESVTDASNEESSFKQAQIICESALISIKEESIFSPTLFSCESALDEKQKEIIFDQTLVSGDFGLNESENESSLNAIPIPCTSETLTERNQITSDNPHTSIIHDSAVNDPTDVSVLSFTPTFYDPALDASEKVFDINVAPIVSEPVTDDRNAEFSSSPLIVRPESALNNEKARESAIDSSLRPGDLALNLNPVSKPDDCSEHVAYSLASCDPVLEGNKATIASSDSARINDDFCSNNSEPRLVFAMSKPVDKHSAHDASSVSLSDNFTRNSCDLKSESSEQDFPCYSVKSFTPGHILTRFGDKLEVIREEVEPSDSSSCIHSEALLSSVPEKLQKIGEECICDSASTRSDPTRMHSIDFFVDSYSDSTLANESLNEKSDVRSAEQAIPSECCSSEIFTDENAATVESISAVTNINSIAVHSGCDIVSARTFPICSETTAIYVENNLDLPKNVDLEKDLNFLIKEKEGATERKELFSTQKKEEDTIEKKELCVIKEKEEDKIERKELDVHATVYCMKMMASAEKDLLADKENKFDDDNLSNNIRQGLEEQIGVKTQEQAEKSNELIANSIALLVELNAIGELNNNLLSSSDVDMESMLVNRSNEVDVVSDTVVKESNQIEMDVNKMNVMSNETREKEDMEEDAEESDEESKSSTSTDSEDGELGEEEEESEGESEESGWITARELVQNKRGSKGDGMESSDLEKPTVGMTPDPCLPSTIDVDEDQSNPAYIPRKGPFYEHDLRGGAGDNEEEEDGRTSGKRVWNSSHDEPKWLHDKFDERAMAPKTHDDILEEYGYDIRARGPNEPIRGGHRAGGDRGGVRGMGRTLGDFIPSNLCRPSDQSEIRNARHDSQSGSGDAGRNRQRSAFDREDSKPCGRFAESLRDRFAINQDKHFEGESAHPAAKNHSSPFDRNNGYSMRNQDDRYERNNKHSIRNQDGRYERNNNHSMRNQDGRYERNNGHSMRSQDGRFETMSRFGTGRESVGQQQTHFQQQPIRRGGFGLPASQQATTSVSATGTVDECWNANPSEPKRAERFKSQASGTIPLNDRKQEAVNKVSVKSNDTNNLLEDCGAATSNIVARLDKELDRNMTAVLQPCPTGTEFNRERKTSLKADINQVSVVSSVATIKSNERLTHENVSNLPRFGSGRISGAGFQGNNSGGENDDRNTESGGVGEKSSEERKREEGIARDDQKYPRPKLQSSSERERMSAADEAGSARSRNAGYENGRRSSHSCAARTFENSAISLPKFGRPAAGNRDKGGPGGRVTGRIDAGAGLAESRRKIIVVEEEESWDGRNIRVEKRVESRDERDGEIPKKLCEGKEAFNDGFEDNRGRSEENGPGGERHSTSMVDHAGCVQRRGGCGTTQDWSTERVTKRPPHSYMNLIQMALCSDPNMRMTLREIYDWIETRFPYYKHVSNQGWKNSIRHNLSLYDIFVRKKPTHPCKASSSYWTMKCDDITTTVADYRERARKAAELNRCEGSVNQASNGTADPGLVSPLNRTQPSRKGPVPLLPKPSAIGTTFTFVPFRDVSTPAPAVMYHTAPPQPVVMSSAWLVGAAQQPVEAARGCETAALATAPNAAAVHSSATKRRAAAVAAASMPGAKKKRVADAPTFSTTTRSRAAILPRRRASLEPSQRSSLGSSQGSSLGPSRAPVSPHDPPSLDHSLTLAVDTDSSLNLNTSELRHQLSFLNFDPVLDFGFASDGQGHRRESGEEGSSFGGCSLESQDCVGQASTVDCDDVLQRGLPKPRIYRNRRRKQEFKVLSSPSDPAKVKVGRTENDLSTPVRRKQSHYSGVRNDSVVTDDQKAPSFSVVEADGNSQDEVVQFLRTPGRQRNEEEEEEDLMLFTPFRLGGAANALLASPSWLSPIKGLGCLGSTPAWGAMMLSPERDTTRTSTPCAAHRTPDRAASSIEVRGAALSMSRLRESAFRTPDGPAGSWRLGGAGSTPDRLNKILFSEQSPPDIGFIVRSPNFRRLLGDFQDEGASGSPGGGGVGGGDLEGSEAFGFSPLR